MEMTKATRTEFKGQDLAEAISLAGVALALPPEQVKFIVVSTGSKGFLGFGRRSACISVDLESPSVVDVAEVKPAEPENKTGPIAATKYPTSKNSFNTPQPEKPWPVTSSNKNNLPRYNQAAHTQVKRPLPEKQSVPAKSSEDSRLAATAPTTPTFGQSTTTYGQSAPTFGQSAPTYGQSAPTFGQSTTTYGQSTPTFGQSTTTYGQSTTTYGQSTPTFGQSTPTFGQSTPTFGQSTPLPSEPQKYAKYKSSSPEILPLEWSEIPLPKTHPGPGEVVENATGADADLCLSVIKEILKHLKIEAEITAKYIGPRLVIAIDSPDNALLIGSHGVALEALQLLVSKVVARQAEDIEAPPQIVIDVADYQTRRWEQLLITLKAAASKARQTQRPQAINVLNPSEKRLIHIALEPFKDLIIKNQWGSDGLTICPASAPPQARRYRGSKPY